MLKQDLCNRNWRTTVATVALGLWAVVTPAWADWDPSDPAKWVQMPDLVNGMNVDAQAPKILADDFLCTQTGLITDIHIWGSWWHDLVNPATVFRLGIWSDNPATITRYSTPRDLLWEHDFKPGEYRERPWAPSFEPFFDPARGQVGYDNMVWQYNFLIDPSVAFTQHEREIYWLSVQTIALAPIAPYGFGWKTSFQHWNDDATWAFKDTPGPAPGLPWQELIDFRTGQSLDLAFALTTTVPDGGASALLLGVGFLALGLVRRYLRQ
jgi:hypothetical protein